MDGEFRGNPGDLQSRLTSGSHRFAAAIEQNSRILSQSTPIRLADQEQGAICRVASGWAVCRRLFPDGRSQIMSVLVPGDIAGAQALLIQPSLDIIEPCETVSVQSISRSKLLSLVAEDPDIALWLLWQANQENRRNERWLTVLAQYSAQQKVAFLLLDLHRRAAQLGSHRRAASRVPLSQAQIADHLGLTVPHVSRLLTNLRRRGAISTAYRSLEIVNTEPLNDELAGLEEF